MEHNFSITNMTIVDGKPNEAGNRLLAAIDLKVGGMQTKGFLIVEKEDGRIICTGGKGKTRHGHALSMQIEDVSLREAIVERASLLYEGFTGRCIMAAE